MITEKMQALVYEGPRLMNLREMAVPTPGTDDVLIQVAFSGICGSELGGYLGHNSLRKPPLVMGHEFSGQIVAMGTTAAKLNPDLRLDQAVTVNPLLYCGRCRYCLAGRQQLCTQRVLIGAGRPGSYADYITVPAAAVHPLPEGLTLEQGALVEPVACALRIAQIAAIQPADRMLVIGAGPIGLLALCIAHYYGVESVWVADTNPDRLAIVQALGGQPINPRETDLIPFLMAQTETLGVEVAIDAVGAAITRQQCVQAAAMGGRVVFTGLHEEASTIPVNLAIRREIQCLGSFAYTALNFKGALSLLSRGVIRLEPWTISRPLAEGGACFERLINDPGKVAKILLIP